MDFLIQSFNERKISLISGSYDFAFEKYPEDYSKEIKSFKTLYDLLSFEVSLINKTNIGFDCTIDPISYVSTIDESFYFEGQKILKSNNKPRKKLVEYINVEYEINKLLKDINLDWEFCYVTGGSIVNLVKNIFYEYTELDKKSDIDIIVSIENYNNGECFLREQIKKAIPEAESIQKIRDFNYKVNYKGRVYQFFAIEKQNVLSCIYRFHLSCCRVIYNKNEGLRVTPMCYYSIKNLINYWNHQENVTKDNILKYRKRGFDFILNETEYNLFEDLKC